MPAKAIAAFKIPFDVSFAQASCPKQFVRVFVLQIGSFNVQFSRLIAPHRTNMGQSVDFIADECADDFSIEQFKEVFGSFPPASMNRPDFLTECFFVRRPSFLPRKQRGCLRAVNIASKREIETRYIPADFDRLFTCGDLAAPSRPNADEDCFILQGHPPSSSNGTSSGRASAP